MSASSKGTASSSSIDQNLHSKFTTKIWVPITKIKDVPLSKRQLNKSAIISIPTMMKLSRNA